MENRPGLKHRDFKPCLLCGKGMMNANNITFFRLTIERHMIDVRAVQRAHGMEMMMGGNALLANVMGPDEDLAKQVSTDTFFVCEPCSLRSETRVFALYEKVSEDEEARDDGLTGRTLYTTDDKL